MIGSMLRVGWHFMSHPMGRRTLLAGILEFSSVWFVSAAYACIYYWTWGHIVADLSGIREE